MKCTLVLKLKNSPEIYIEGKTIEITSDNTLYVEFLIKNDDNYEILKVCNSELILYRLTTSI